MNNCRGKHMKPLLQCWENFGLPGENYELGYCGVDRSPQIFAKNCAGASNALPQSDQQLCCTPCQMAKLHRSKGIMQLMKKKLEQTMLVESIVHKAFVCDYDLSTLNAFVRNSKTRLSEKGQVLKRKADAFIRRD